MCPKAVTDCLCSIKNRIKEMSDKNMSLEEMIEAAKKSEYGATWYSEKGPIAITKEGKLEPIFMDPLPHFDLS